MASHTVEDMTYTPEELIRDAIESASEAEPEGAQYLRTETVAAITKRVLAVLPGYTQRIQAETLKDATTIARSIERSGNPATGVISDELLRRAAALAAPVEPTPQLDPETVTRELVKWGAEAVDRCADTLEQLGEPRAAGIARTYAKHLRESEDGAAEVQQLEASLAAPPVEQPAPQPNVIDAAHIARQHQWSQRTFGPKQRVEGVLDHLGKELVEVAAAPDDVSEWADVVILGIDGACRAGHSPQTIIDAIHAKQARNEARDWPDWHGLPDDKAIEHVRSAPPVEQP